MQQTRSSLVQRTCHTVPFVPVSRVSHGGAARVGARQAARSVALAAKLDDKPLISSSLLGGGPMLEGPSSSKPAASKGVADVPLLTERNMDYSMLRDVLKEGDFRKADDETRALIIKLGGEGAVKRNWVYFTEVKDIPAADLQTIDNLWRAASGNKFGYSVQRDLWMQCSKRWPKFFKQIDWVQGENNVYRKWPMEFVYSKDAVKGHLPLTNALRGTQLFQALLEHPAWDKSAASKGKSLDDIAREQSAAGSKLF